MKGLGTDIIEIDRIQKAIAKESFVRHVFTEQEQIWLKEQGKQMPQSAAGLFCAKEAVAKALGTGFQQGLHFHDIEIAHTELGQPYVRKPKRRFLLSISHCQTYATAAAILLDDTMDRGQKHADN